HRPPPSALFPYTTLFRSRAREEMDHLIAVAQLLGHDSQRPRVVLRLLRSRERALVLLNGAELGGCLCLDLHQEVLRGLLRQILRRERFRLALAFADLDLCRDIFRDLGAKAERLVLWEEAVPFLGELRKVGEVVPLPVLDGVVVLLRQRPDVVFHTSSVPSLVPEWSYRSRERTDEAANVSATRAGSSRPSRWDRQRHRDASRRTSQPASRPHGWSLRRCGTGRPHRAHTCTRCTRPHRTRCHRTRRRALS